MSDKPEPINPPDWLDDVIADNASDDGGIFSWAYADVEKTVLAAIAHDRAERQRRPWADVDSKSDYGAFVQWLANGHGLINLNDHEYQVLYRIFLKIYTPE